MEPRHLIRAAIIASVLAHLALVAGVFLADARPIEQHEDSVGVDLVTPQDLREAEKKAKDAQTEPAPAKQPEPKPDFQLPDLTTKPTPDEQKAAPAASKSPPSQQQSQTKPSSQQPPAPPPTASEPQSTAQQQPPAQQMPVQQPSAQQSAAQPQPKQGDPQPSPPQQQQAAMQPPPAAPAGEAAPAQPDADITVKYGVMLGLPGFSGPASQQADVSKADIAAFHRHLKTCLKLPASVARSDDAMVKLRALLSPDGRLLTEPTVIEVRRPTKAALLLQAARQALEACQPYSMLPADKYDEWKVLDLPFTPQDFAS